MAAKQCHKFDLATIWNHTISNLGTEISWVPVWNWSCQTGQHCLHSQISFWVSILHNPIGWCIRGLTKTVMDTVVSTLALSSLSSTLLHGSHIVTHLYILINKPWSCQCNWHNLWSYSSFPPLPQVHKYSCWSAMASGVSVWLVCDQCLSPLTSRKLHKWRGRSQFSGAFVLLG